MNIFLIFYFAGLYLISLSNGAKRKAQGKIGYEANWSAGFKLCENFQNSVFEFSTLKVDKISAVGTVLSGEFEFTSPVMPGTSMFAMVEKETPQGKVLTFTFALPDLCDHVPDEGESWSKFFDAMKLEERKCPLPAKKYLIESFELSVSTVAGFFTHENVGEYVATVQLSHKGEGLGIVDKPLTCYTFSFSIDEIREQVEETTE